MYSTPLLISAARLSAERPPSLPKLPTSREPLMSARPGADFKSSTLPQAVERRQGYFHEFAERKKAKDALAIFMHEHFTMIGDEVVELNRSQTAIWPMQFWDKNSRSNIN